MTFKKIKSNLESGKSCKASLELSDEEKAI